MQQLYLLWLGCYCFMKHSQYFNTVQQVEYNLQRCRMAIIPYFNAIVFVQLLYMHLGSYKYVKLATHHKIILHCSYVTNWQVRMCVMLYLYTKIYTSLHSIASVL